MSGSALIIGDFFTDPITIQIVTAEFPWKLQFHFVVSLKTKLRLSLSKQVHEYSCLGKCNFVKVSILLRLSLSGNLQIGFGDKIRLNFYGHRISFLSKFFFVVG